MRYQGSEARSLDAAERGQLGRNARRQGAPSFDVVEGRGLDARVRRGISPQFRACVAMAAIAIVCILLGAFARVVITTAAAGTLTANEELRTEIRDARSTEKDLRVTSAMLSSESRIERIATQNYGMTRAGDTSSEQGAVDEVSGSTSTSGSTGDSTSGFATDASARGVDEVTSDFDA